MIVKKGVKKRVSSSEKSKPSSNVKPQSNAKPQKSTKPAAAPQKTEKKIIDRYEYKSKNIPITISIYRQSDEFVPIYSVSISSISPTTELILEKIRQELIKHVNIGIVDITNLKGSSIIEERYSETIAVMIKKYFPDIDEETEAFLTTYLIQKSLGMGNIEVLMDDKLLEEIVINNAEEPVWVYHKKHSWLKTNIKIENEDQTKHFATMIGRRVGRQITVLEPLLDANLDAGDRVNATLMPISNLGNTITLRKFSRDPFTITHFLKFRTMSPSAAALVWHGMQFELSALIAGGTASGKTSTLNVLASFLPPNQRIISIEDTRELRLPKFLHWLPMVTRQPNPEGKGQVSMEDLLVNSLRQRPDRILVGEVRRKKEAETLFEAIHTGHSVYATFHANNASETVKRLINPPVDVPEMLLPAINMVIVQFRNRRTGLRRTFQIAEITEDAKPNVIQQYDARKDVLVNINKSKALLETLQLYTGYSFKETRTALLEKELVLKYMVKLGIDTIDDVGRVIAEYYTNKPNLLSAMKQQKRLR